MSECILLIDDDKSLCRVMEFALQQAGHEVHVAFSGVKGLELFRRYRPSLVVTDVQMPELTGFQLLEDVQKLDRDVLFIFITGYSTIPNAVAAIKAGAYDYLTKPFSNDQLCLTVKKSIDYINLQRNNRILKKKLIAQNEIIQIIGQSRPIQSLLQRVEKVAASQASVLLTGESGTGKELVARTLHQGSKRADEPYVVVNCAAIPHNLIESELFGYLKGTFTGAFKDRKGKFSLANKGTLFLDEIGELPVELQSKLLRALQEKEIEPIGGTPEKIDVRIIAATNKDMEESISDGSFREDLYYRLAVIPIHLPPLRERKEDIPLLIAFFLRKFGTSNEIVFSDNVIELMQIYHWPGNIRELQNAVEQILILRRSNRIEKVDLPPHISKEGRLGYSIFKLPEKGYPLDELEKEAIRQALSLSYGNKTKAAEYLHISRHTLNYRIDKYSL